ncbi:MAG: hypothetical protein IPM21_17245 [Acidobacteria bacterium]|nr:hypothetical protein [Acidobacteriota bacterium]
MLFSFWHASGQSNVTVGEPFKLCSSYFPQTGNIGSAVGDHRGVFLAETGGRVRLLHQKTLETIWSAEVGGNIVSNLLLSRDSLFVTANTDSDEPASRLREINLNTGLTRNTYDLEFSKSYLLKKAGESVLVVPEAGAPQMLDSSGLTPAGRFAFWSTGDRVLFADDDQLLVVSTNGISRVVSWVAATMPSYQPTADRLVASALITANGRLITGNGKGEIRSEQLGVNGRVWKFKTGGEIVFADSFDGKILIASNDNFLYLLGEQNGSVIWRSRLPGRPSTGRVLRDDSVAIGVLGEERIFIIDLSNGKVRNFIQLEENEEVQPGGVLETQPGGLALLTSRGLRAYSSSAGCGKNE